jgi:methylphosphotriester-DNA--protein-cysteine methyltransferase
MNEPKKTCHTCQHYCNAFCKLWGAIIHGWRPCTRCVKAEEKKERGDNA